MSNSHYKSNVQEKYNENLFQVASNIRKWRTLRGIKQEALATILNISSVSLSKIETGKTNIPILRLFEIAIALNIKVQMLFIDPCTIIEERQHNR